MNQLQDLVLRRLAELGEPSAPMSARRAAERSNGLVTYETMRIIARGEHSGKLTDRVAEGLSRALEVPLAEIYDAAKLPRRTTRWIMPERFDRLDMAQRRIVEDVAAALLESYEKGLRDSH